MADQQIFYRWQGRSRAVELDLCAGCLPTRTASRSRCAGPRRLCASVPSLTGARLTCRCDQINGDS